MTKVLHGISLTPDQHHTLTKLQDGGNPAIMRGAFSDEVIALDHTSGVITEHFIWADGSMESWVMTGIDWDELPSDNSWLDIPREELHEELKLV